MAFLEFADEAEAAEEFIERYSDGLPVVLPTPARVSKLLSETSRDPDATLGVMMPRGTPVTVRDVAVNAVMAGAPPGVLPIILTAMEGVLDERFNLSSVQATSHGAAVLVIVSGPLTERVGMNAGYNVFGNGNRANLTIGRTVRLVMTNVGGGAPGLTDMSVQGSPAKISFCMAERLDVEGWSTLAERQGAPADATTVTVVAAEGPHSVADGRSTRPERLLTNVADGMRTLVTMNACKLGWMVLILSPQHARIIIENGWDVPRVQAYLFDRARNTLARLQKAGEFDENALARFKQFASTSNPSRGMPVIDDPEKLIVAVAGGDAGTFSSLVPTWPASIPQVRVVA